MSSSRPPFTTPDGLLSVYFPKDGDPSAFNDAEIAEIARLLQLCGHAYLKGVDHPNLFDIGDRLGSGGYGQVDKILSKISYKEYAMKRILRHAEFRKTKVVIKEFLKEKTILQSLDHRHIVRYVGSFTDAAHFGIVMSPIADCDLASYFNQACFDTAKHPTVQKFFGCLANALYYLHSKNIRHRDIKPGNILIHQGNVLIKDFGLSRGHP
ncbi:kinase-like domain-containing protein [Dendryphion nanum]|uniref:Kinase-like domain-containing protein n=1 Tax=Dendryphion nanum TaxID=256645 RepID=A0A9P9E6B9_9PLEO|nr:kinase-like domain-containing protein [Dendryphion nanum]